MQSWKASLSKLGVIAFGVGAGLGLVALLTFWIMSPSSQWNAKAIKATYVSSEYSAKPDPAGYFTYTLENTTSKDYSVKLLENDNSPALPSNLRAAARRGTKGSTALVFGGIDFFIPSAGSIGNSIDVLAKGEPLFLPAKQKVNIVLRWEFEGSELSKTSSADIVNTSLAGFVLYDDAPHYEIDFPRPDPIQGKFTEADVKGAVNDAKTVEPDKLKPWEKYAACSEATKLVASCKAARLYTAVPNGWWTIPLPILPSPPPGYDLDATADSCKAAAEWESYCANSK